MCVRPQGLASSALRSARPPSAPSRPPHRCCRPDTPELKRRAHETLILRPVLRRGRRMNGSLSCGSATPTGRCTGGTIPVRRHSVIISSVNALHIPGYLPSRDYSGNNPQNDPPAPHPPTSLPHASRHTPRTRLLQLHGNKLVSFISVFELFWQRHFGNAILATPTTLPASMVRRSTTAHDQKT